jgi:hypothetical protein
MRFRLLVIATSILFVDVCAFGQPTAPKAGVPQIPMNAAPTDTGGGKPPPYYSYGAAVLIAGAILAVVCYPSKDPKE